MNFYLEGYRKYAVFTGRASKEEYYGFNSWNLMFLIISIGSNYIFKTSNISLSYIAIMILPAISLSVRRLHDVGENGWYILKWNGKKKMKEEGMKKKNKYGEAPKNL